MREHFLLDEAVTFLNHGSFGACPRPVFERYQAWQLELERQPVAFLGRRYESLMGSAKGTLAHYLGTDAMNLTFVPNATTGINTVARSLQLEPGDEILATDHAYGAIDFTWEYICKQTGAWYLRQSIPLPYDSDDAFVERLWQGVTPRTKVIAISHITSPTALTFPIQAVCDRAREAGILTVIDGAHAPGQIPLDLEAVGADFYAGNCHKWLCAPKGAGFLYVRPEHQAMVDPLVISWGYGQREDFAGRHGWQGTRDIAAFLSVPDAIAFQAAHDWHVQRARCHDLAVETQGRIADLTGLAPIASSGAFEQMVTVALPVEDAKALQATLYERFRVEVPGIAWNGGQYIRISFQAYNTREDAGRLLAGLGQLLADD